LAGIIVKPHYAFIECARGYAVLLVVIAHATYLFPGLPYPIHRLTVMGWYGVQLFFLASAVTLMMSWRYEKTRTGSVDIGAFFIRRICRIAPAYYAAAVLYFLLEPPSGGFDLQQAAASLLFVNAWHPDLLPTVPTHWTVVPGGWSIGVEFSFYAVFPFAACWITSLSRAVWLVLATLLIGAALNTLISPSLMKEFGVIPADNFLFFWFPNQMSVFALGLVLFFVLERERTAPQVRYANALAIASVILVLAVAYLHAPHWLALRNPVPPAFILVTLALMLFMLALSRARSGLLLNPVIALFGRVSFSAYLLHFAILAILQRTPPFRDYIDATDWTAAITFAATLATTLVLVLGVSWCSYHLIERPMIAAGKSFIRRRHAALAGT
jgi:peptidoglycan/LPS O-acetylase OafA/YrhL